MECDTHFFLSCTLLVTARGGGTMNYNSEFLVVATFVKKTSQKKLADMMNFLEEHKDSGQAAECRDNVWIFKNVSVAQKHGCLDDDGNAVKVNICQKPIRLLRHIVEHFSRPNDCVLDLCSGTQSTAVACILSNRHCVSVEMAKFQFNQGITRVQGAVDAIAAATDKDSCFTDITGKEF